MQKRHHKSQSTDYAHCSEKTGGVQRQTASLDSLPCPLPFVPTAAGRPDSTVCYDLEEVMCEREGNVLSSWPGQYMLGKKQSTEKWQNAILAQ